MDHFINRFNPIVLLFLFPCLYSNGRSIIIVLNSERIQIHLVILFLYLNILQLHYIIVPDVIFIQIHVNIMFGKDAIHFDKLFQILRLVLYIQITSFQLVLQYFIFVLSSHNIDVRDLQNVLAQILYIE